MPGATEDDVGGDAKRERPRPCVQLERAGAPQALRGFDGAEGFVPEYDRFAGFLPQALGEIAELPFAGAAAGARRQTQNQRFRPHGIGNRGDPGHDVALVRQHGMRRGQDPRIADRDSDAAAAVVDGHQRHRSILVA